MNYSEIWVLYAAALLAVAFAWFLVNKTYFRRSTQNKEKGTYSDEKASLEPTADPYLDIEPLSSFDWRITPPLKLRPFKPKYHLTLALENTTISDLIAMDNTYLDRIHLRRKLLSTLTTEIVDAHPTATPSIHEFYTWTFIKYLPRRFPTMFTLDSSSSTLLNITTQELIPTTPPTSPDQCLRTISAHIDTDFLILLPDATGEYVLRAYTTAFPAGFDTRTKMNRTLTAIHGPVPAYASKLQKSMTRYFASIPAGKVVRRSNWSITTDRHLYTVAGTHFNAAEDLQSAREAVDVRECVLRSEWQTLHLLWGTRALVFGVKTYQYELKDIREEGNGLALAEAVEGLGRGSVPEMEVYKRGLVWGEKVCRFLRGEDEVGA